MSHNEQRDKLLTAIDHYSRAWGEKEQALRRNQVVELIEEVLKRVTCTLTVDSSKFNAQTLGDNLGEYLEKQLVLPPENQEPVCDDADPSFRINSAQTVAVSTNVYLEKVNRQTPRGVKLQLLTAGGVLVYGYYHGEGWITHWAPCPRRRG